MDEDKALALAQVLTARGVRCHIVPVGGYGHTVLVGLADGREGDWDVREDVAEARVLRDGALIGFVSLPRDSARTLEATAALIADERCDRLSAVGSSGALADPGQRRWSADRGGTAAPRARSGQTALLLIAMVVVLLALYLLGGRR